MAAWLPALTVDITQQSRDWRGVSDRRFYAVTKEGCMVMTVASEASWLLLALGTAGRRKHPDLSNVLGTADAINHAVMTYPEFRRATGLLMAEGLVEPPEGLRLTPAGKELLKAHRSPTWHQHWVALRNALERSEAAEASPTSVTETAFDEAVSEYLARHE